MDRPEISHTRCCSDDSPKVNGRGWGAHSSVLGWPGERSSATGISRVPSLFRHVENFEDMGVPQGVLPQAQWLGTRPPRLDDYLVDEVAATIEMPAAQRLIVIQALESTLNG
jgi:hypothetical protein